MEVSYKKLWKLLIDKNMKKKDLQAVAGISWASITKLSKGKTVSMEVLIKITNMGLRLFLWMKHTEKKWSLMQPLI